MKNKNLALSALFAALIFIVISIHIPNGLGGVVHFGDALIFIAATLLPFPYAFVVAAVGAGLFNLVFAPIWLPFTIVIKPIMTLCFTNKTNLILGTKRNIAAPFAGAAINIVLYFGANWILFGHSTAIAALTSLSIQGIGSVVFFFVIAFALDRAKIKERLFLN